MEGSGTVLSELEWSTINAKDLSELGNALFQAGYALMTGTLTQGEYERLRELGKARRAAFVKKLRMQERLSWAMSRRKERP
jgi:hypothetical protein